MMIIQTIDKRNSEKKKEAIKLIASKFTFIEDLIKELSNSEINRIYQNALDGEYDDL